jgi:hypothetical protein
VELNNGWRTNSGDNIAWAQREFVDSLWPATTLGEKTPLPAGWTWYRLTLQIPPQTEEPLALLVTAPGGTCEVYVDGRRASSETIGSWFHMTAARAQVVPLPQHSGVIHIALRLDYHKPLAARMAHLSMSESAVLSGIQAAAASTIDDRVLDFLPVGFAYEYFWLGLYLVIDASRV